MKAEVIDEVVDRLFEEERFDWVGVRIPLGEGVCGTVAATGKTEVVPEVNARPGHIQCFLTTKSEVVAAIVKDGTVAAGGFGG